MKNYKKFISALLSVIIMLSVMPFKVIAANVPPSGSGTSDDPYIIENAYQLLWWANRAGSAPDSSCANLANDINFYSEWTPISSYKSVFDGKGHTIYGLYIAEIPPTNAAMFANLNGTVKNLKIDKSEIYGKTRAAGVAATLSGGTINNCSYKGTLSLTAENKSGYIGNVAAYATGGTIENCINENDIRLTYPVGYLGGICGYSKIQLENCTNTAQIGGNGSEYVGGIAGKAECTNSYSVDFSGLINTGHIGEQYGTSDVHVGGISFCGNTTYYSNSSYKLLSLYNCINKGYVYGTEAYGIWGGSLQYCINEGNIYASNAQTFCAGLRGDYGSSSTPSIKNSYNTGDIKNTKGTAYGIFAKSNANNCYNTGNISSAASSAGSYAIFMSVTSTNTDYNCYIMSGTGFSASYYKIVSRDDFSNGRVAYLLNGGAGGNTWFQNIDLGVKDEYPVFDSNHYRVYLSGDTYTNKRRNIWGVGDDGISYTVDITSGTLELEGDGTMKNYSAKSTAPWYSERNYIFTVYVKGNIIIDDYAFYGMNNITEVYVDKGLPADDISLYPSGVTLKYNNGDADTTTEVTSEVTSEVTTESSTEVTTAFTTENTTEPTTIDGGESTNVKVHYDSVYKKKYSTGVYSDGYKYSLGGGYSDATEADKTITVHPNETLLLNIVNTLGNIKKTQSWEYDEIVFEKITDIWISRDEIYTSKPTVWGEDVTLSILGDVDGDGLITVLDATHILKKASNEAYKFPLESN